MKVIVLVLITLLSMSLSSNKNKFLSLNNKQIEHTIPISPVIYERLPEHRDINSINNIVQTSQEANVISNSPFPDKYYDGSIGMRTDYSICSQLPSNDACIENDKCGVCVTSGACQPGSQSGPFGNLCSNFAFTKEELSKYNKRTDTRFGNSIQILSSDK